MPTPAQLPPELRPLATLQAIALRDDTWHEDVARLAEALGEGSPVLSDGSPPAGAPSDGRRRRSAGPVALMALLAAVLAVVGVAIGALLLDEGHGQRRGRRRRRRDERRRARRGRGRGVGDPAAVPDPEWSRLDGRRARGVDRRSGDGAPAVWSFELLGGGYRQLPSGRWQLVLRLRATNEAVGSAFHYPFYTVLADGAAASLTCFQVVEGDTMTSPGRLE